MLVITFFNKLHVVGPSNRIVSHEVKSLFQVFFQGGSVYTK